jgi:mono/diheme cytochrome c family protein
MTTPGILKGGWLAIVLLCFALSQAVPCKAETTGEADLAALQADAKKVFRDGVTPFVNTYCTRCHGQNRQRGGINFQPALSNPGDAAAARRWKQAVANVKAHDMPPESADKQPTDEERRQFAEWIGKIKFLSPKDPGPFVIRRLTKAEYANTLHDLLSIDPAVAKDLPDEVFGAGYLNTLSPLQSEQYLAIANEVVERILAPDGKPPTPVQKRLFGKTPAPGADGGEESGAVIGQKRLSPSGVRGGGGGAAAGVRSGARKQTQLPRLPAPHAQGGPRFAAVPLHHARHGNGAGTRHRSPG